MMMKSKSAYERGNSQTKLWEEVVCYYAFIQCFLSFNKI